MPKFHRAIVFLSSAAVIVPLAACGPIYIDPGPWTPNGPSQPPINPQPTDSLTNIPVDPGPNPGPEPTRSVVPPRPSEPSEPKQGTYRITVNGVSVKSQTNDHALEQDGKGDEVYVDLSTKVIDNDGDEKESRQVTTSIMGDTNQQAGRIQAGSARGGKGGIITGDKMPTAKPWAIEGVPIPEQLPLNGGEITLAEGQDKALITPTVWEWDGGSDLFTQFTKWFDKAAEKVPAEALGPATGVGKAASSMNLGDTLSKLFGVAGDRPIGIQGQDREGYSFDPQIVTLDYAKAEEVSTSDLGWGKGVRMLTFKDAPQFAGHYELYYQITKVS